MAAKRIEIALKPELPDAEGENVRKKALKYFGIRLETVRVVNILTIDAELSFEQLEKVRKEVFTNPVTQISSQNPLPIPFDQTVWIGFRPGVRDNPGATAVEAISDILGFPLKQNEKVYTSKRFCISGGGISREDAETIARELLANDIIQEWRTMSREEWDPKQGFGIVLPKIQSNHDPAVTTIPVTDIETLRKISDERNLALNPADLPVIRGYFRNPTVLEERARFGLADPTDVELEYISQARSDHCNHNTFQGLFRYRDLDSGKSETLDNLFDTFIRKPTLDLKEKKPWVVSVLWDNAGVGLFDEGYYYTITGETHNSPSNMEAYGGAITGIVGVYRDPMGTGRGSKLVMGGYGYCVGPWDYSGEKKPRLHPRRLLDGVVEGVRDGGNKSGIPTTYGQVLFHPGYLGKCLVFVTAVGLMPTISAGEPTEQKVTSPGDLVVMCGGRVGKDGIHGVTASSEVFSETTPACHVQIGDPYTQKKMHDFLLEARDSGLIRFITDNGGGGLSSSVGESAHFSNGCEIELEKVPLKYEGLDPWEIWISESQERMTVAVRPEDIQAFLDLSRRHAVESTVIGTYTDTGKLHILYRGKTVAYVDLDFLASGFPQWEFDAEWIPPETRNLIEPVLGEPKNFNGLFLAMLERPNICSREWIVRQYDHEVQGTSVIKPLVGIDRDMVSDASVIQPVLDSNRGIAYAQAVLPQYSAIDAGAMTECVIDEAVRRLISVGGSIRHIGGVDNFCWPDIRFDTRKNPDGKFKAAQLVRSCKALQKMCSHYGIPLLSGKDSMYVDGHLEGKYGETHKVSALPTLQFSTIGVVEDITNCVSMDAKFPDDLVYVLGVTKNELGGSEYYEYLGYIGKHVPTVHPESFLKIYRGLEQAIRNEIPASVHGVYRGGLGIHLALCAMGGNLGMTIDLSRAPTDGIDRNDTLLFSETPGRFVVTVDPEKKEAFEACFQGLPVALIGKTTESPDFRMNGLDGKELLNIPVNELKNAWKRPFGEMK